MIRTQISLTDEQASFLKAVSARRHRSVSAVIREAVDELRRREASPVEQALALLGAFEADRTDVAVRHDTYFPEEEP
ncbi:MAG: ribbon-helix-helix protein, CopG family [Deltaproteobacteria bacterium]|nr:ribbon-helix-helix protein, CopG family [Deltaproteobacteria bacterium]